MRKEEVMGAVGYLLSLLSLTISNFCCITLSSFFMTTLPAQRNLLTFFDTVLLHLIDARWWPWERAMWFHLFPNWMALQVYLHLQHPLPLLPLHLHHSTSPALDRPHRGKSAWAQLIQKQEHVGKLVATTVVKNFVAIIPLLKSVKWTVVPTTAISKCLVVMFGPSWMQIVANTRSFAAHIATVQHIPALNPDTNPPSLSQC